MDTASQPVVLVDGSSYLFRAFHALPPLINSKGLPTGAIYGVINMLRKLRNDYKPEYMAVIFDPKGKTTRDSYYPEYKANRPSMPEELAQQIKPLHELIEAMGLPLIIVDGVEADDVIGTLAKDLEAQGKSVLISTGDKDMAQLVNEHVTLINTMSNQILDIDGVVEKFGIRPDQIIDYLALMGDSVDNIPGIPKVGPKTAVKWLHQYETLDSIKEHADDIAGKIGENLRNNLEQLDLSKRLVTIETDIASLPSLEDLKPNTPDQEELIEWFTELEFKTWLKESLENSGAEATKSEVKVEYDTILTQSDLSRWIKTITEAEYFAFDTETTSLDPMVAELVGISFSVEANKAAYLPLQHRYEEAPEQISLESALEQLKPIFEDPKYLKIGHNLKYDIKVLAQYDIFVQGLAHDTLLESYLLNSSSTRHDMDTLALKYLGHKNISFEEVAGSGKQQLTFDFVDLDKASEYAAEDADITWQLHQPLNEQLQEFPKLTQLLTDVEMPLLSVLAHMECHGVKIDAPLLLAQSKELAKRINELEEEAYRLADKTFNLASPKQLQAILFDELELPIIKKTPKGQPSTAEDVLQELAHEFPLPKIIIEHRQLSKLKSTYTDKLPLQINDKTGRIHTSYNQAVTATGRLSSTDPNLQNIPIRTEEGRAIRKAFIAPEGYVVFAADYSQIELRIMAHLSKDKRLIDAFRNNLDIHKATASEVFSVSLEEVTSEQRRRAKAINFGLIYGMSAFGLAKQLGIDRNAAQLYIDIYFDRYPGVMQYMNDTKKLAHEQGFVETLLGRRLYLPEINASNQMRRKAAERAAINAPMQGTAADIIKKAMICVDQWLAQSDTKAKLIMQVHDELVLEIPEEELEHVKQHVVQCMEEAGGNLAIPLIVDTGYGDSWEQAH